MNTFEFIDNDNKRYKFELNPELDTVGTPHILITVHYPDPSKLSSTTLRMISDNRVRWYLGDEKKVSLGAKNYIDKIIKNKVFI